MLEPSDFKQVIENRLRAGRNDAEELNAVASFAGRNLVPDYQLSAWLTAAYLKPLDPSETAALTLAMAASGERLDLTGLPRPWIDKHSTGGVGDKTSIVLMPLLASLGITMVKMSGRGLGITGGTVDKLESIPGFRSDLSPEEMKAQAARIGVAWTGQTPNLAPADKVLYALRDATGTVDSIPLIVSSILSKKIAGGAERVMIDVKCGSGAFMRDLESARELGEALIATAREANLPLSVEITDMSQPLGRAVGNALEVREAIETLSGATGRFTDFCVELAASTLEACGKATREEALATSREALQSGRALAKAKEWFVAQGASERVFTDQEALPTAPVLRTVTARDAGFVSQVDAATVGKTVIKLGGGRERKDDPIDPAVGIEVLKAVGDPVHTGEELFRIHANSEREASNAEARLLGGFVVTEQAVAAVPLVLDQMKGY